MTKAALCFLTRGDLNQPKLWRTFLNGAGADQYNIYVHAKAPEEVVTPTVRDSLIGRYIPTTYGDFSLMNAALTLLTHAFLADEENTHFIMLSESAVPVVPFRKIHAALKNAGHRSFFDYTITEPGTEHYARRFTVRHHERFVPFFFHEFWFVLSRKHLSRLLLAPGSYDFQATPIPDEHYALDVLHHLAGIRLSEIRQSKTTFVNWADPEVRQSPLGQGFLVHQTVHPKTYKSLSEAEIEAVVQADSWFMRKVDASCDCSRLLPLVR